MHSAFLRTGEGWKLVADYQKILDHDGEFLVNECEEDYDSNLDLIETRSGKYAHCEVWGGAEGQSVLLTRTPLRWTVAEAIDDIDTFGEGRTKDNPRMSHRHSSGHTGDSSYVERGTELFYVQAHCEKCRGVVATVEKTGCGVTIYVFRRNEQLWNECIKQLRVKQSRELKKSLSRHPSKSDFNAVVYEVADKFNCRDTIGRLTLAHLWVWVAAHDVTYGRKATNKLVRTLALKWCYDRSKSRRWLLRWVNKDIVDRIDKRLADSLRLGDKNSRCKPKPKSAKTKSAKTKSAKTKKSVPQAA